MHRSHGESSHLFRPFAEKYARAMDSSWYKRAVDQHSIEPESFVFSVPFDAGRYLDIFSRMGNLSGNKPFSILISADRDIFPINLRVVVHLHKPNDFRVCCRQRTALILWSLLRMRYSSGRDTRHQRRSLVFNFNILRWRLILSILLPRYRMHMYRITRAFK